MVANTTAAKEEFAKSYRVQAAMARMFTWRLRRARRNSRSHIGSRPRWPGCSRGGSGVHGGIREIIQGPGRDGPDVHVAAPAYTEEFAKSYRVQAAMARMFTWRIPRARARAPAAAAPGTPP